MKNKHSLIERFLQTIAVGWFCISFILYYGNFILLPYIIYKYWLVLPILLLWGWYDKETPYKGGRPSRFFLNNPIWKYFRSYFPMQIVKTAELDPNKNYLFCSHPHGYICISVFGNFFFNYSQFKELFPWHSFRTATADFNIKFPLWREYMLGNGLISASQKSLEYLLDDNKKGNIVNLMVGGAAEVNYCEPGEYKIILKRRKGFVRVALRVGCSLVPVVHFGENDVFEVLILEPGSFLHTLQQLLKKVTGMCWFIAYGRYWFFPKRAPITSVVGKPIQLPKISEPTNEEIDHYHALYIKELKHLFDEHKFKNVKDPNNTHLIIVE